MKNKNEKTAHRLGGNIGKLCDQQGINLQNIQVAQIAQYQKIIQSKSGQKN